MPFFRVLIFGLQCIGSFSQFSGRSDPFYSYDPIYFSCWQRNWIVDYHRLFLTFDCWYTSHILDFFLFGWLNFIIWFSADHLMLQVVMGHQNDILKHKRIGRLFAHCDLSFKIVDGITSLHIKKDRLCSKLVENRNGNNDFEEVSW